MADYLLTINAVREKSTPVFNLALEDELYNFDSHFSDKSKLNECVDFIVKLVDRDFKDNYKSIPPHGRWQHLEAGKDKPRVMNLVKLWTAEKVDQTEITKRLIDLFVISVFLDAGAGNQWKYKENDESNPSLVETFLRSEGLAVASYHVFNDGEFSNDPSNKYQVSAEKLAGITEDQFKKWLQVNDTDNQLTGFAGRLKLIRSLSDALMNNEEIFGGDLFLNKREGYNKLENRPGNLVDYLNTKVNGDSKKIDLSIIWNALIQGFNEIWDSRIVLEGKSLGDAWYNKSATKLAKKKKNVTSDDELEDLDKIVPFHKLTQWLTYSLLIPLKNYGGFTILNETLLTGLPEYRNGGLLIDFGLLSIKKEKLSQGLELAEQELKNDTEKIPMYKPDDDLIVEWRCCTVGFLDYILPMVNEKLGVKGTENELVLAQLIEAGSWKAGREIAKMKRPLTCGPPINLLSDGTVF